MSVFWVLGARLLPLYCLVLIGFLAGRFLHVRREGIARLLIYVISPGVILSGITATRLDWSRMALPATFFVLGCGLCLTAFWLSGPLWKESTRNILAFSCGSGNTGYFGLPVAILLLGEESLGLAILAGFGLTLYENTLGFFILARGQHSARESLARVLRLPALYAFLAGVALSLAGVRPEGVLNDLAVSFRGTFSVLGMMMVGLGVASQTTLKLDWRFMGASLAAKFLVWPLLILSLVSVDRLFLHLHGPEIHRMMILMAAVPLPASSVAMATEFQAEPEKAGMAVLMSTLIALVFIPLIATAFIAPA